MMSATLAVVLAGGFGTRVRHLLQGVPKPLVPVAGRPFLEWVLRYLHGQGLQRVLLSCGYLANNVEQFASQVSIPGLRISCVAEASPLGTAGGFLNALDRSAERASDFLVCNGDSLILGGLEPLAKAFCDSRIDAALLAVRVADGSRFGTVDVGEDGLLCGFREKRPGAGHVNGGVYLFRHACIHRFPAKRPLSFEFDVFPALLSAGSRIKVVPSDVPFLDIGTEASLREADGFIQKHADWFR